MGCNSKASALNILATPLTPEHVQQLEDLLATVSPKEVLWVSGYLAGFTRQLSQPVAVPAAVAATPIAHPPYDSLWLSYRPCA